MSERLHSLPELATWPSGIPADLICLDGFLASEVGVQPVIETVRSRVISVLEKLEAQPFFFFNFKGTPSQEEHKIIFSCLKINKMALCG